MIRAYAAREKGGKLEPFDYDPGILADEDVEIAVEYCGICHSDLSMLDNDWGLTTYPFVPGHEVVGTIAALGAKVKELNLGQRVGLGWFSRSCSTCETCMSGDQNLCATAEGTIVGRHGGFAEKVRAHHSWLVPLPDQLDAAKAGPLFCGGITVFNPIVQRLILSIPETPKLCNRYKITLISSSLPLTLISIGVFISPVYVPKVVCILLGPFLNPWLPTLSP